MHSTLGVVVVSPVERTSVLQRCSVHRISRVHKSVRNGDTCAYGGCRTEMMKGVISGAMAEAGGKERGEGGRERGGVSNEGVYKWVWWF